MPAKTTIRVAAAQFHVGTDLDKNLATCLRMIKEAAKGSPDLIVLPEFCNHLSWYTDQEHCAAVSLTIDSPWLAAIAQAAREVKAYVVVNCTIRHEDDDNRCTGTSLMYSPQGKLVASSDKQIYIGHENLFFRPAQTQCPIVDTPIGKIGLYACMDGVINETPRCLSLRGAQILCNSLNSFASDEGDLHIPVRASENRVFIVAANKVGPLIPEELLAPVSAQTGIPETFLNGAGDSQVVAPDGTVLARAGKHEAVIFADIDPSEASDKVYADGSDIFLNRRPELYQVIGQNPDSLTPPPFAGANTVKAAVIQLSKIGDSAIDEAVAQVANAIAEGAQIIALPELFMLESTHSIERVHALQQSQRVIDALKPVCQQAVVVASIVVEENATLYHAVVAIDKDGVCATQKQLHASQRLPWSHLSSEIITLDLPYGRMGFVSGADIHYPELFRVLAMKGVEVVVVPFSIYTRWEVDTVLVERAAENRINLIAATQPSPLGTSFIASLEKDFTVMTPWESRPFDGLLTQPILTRATPQAGITYATVTPACASNKVVSVGTDLLASRPWHLVTAITQIKVTSQKQTKLHDTSLETVL